MTDQERRILQGKLVGLQLALQEVKERLDYVEEWITGIRRMLESGGEYEKGEGCL